jgi:hypothetical protein
MEGVIVQEKKLTPEQKEEIAKTVLPGLDVPIYAALFRVIEDYWSNEDVLHPANDYKAGELQHELSLLKGHLDRALIVLTGMAKRGGWDETIDDHYYLVNNSALLTNLGRSSSYGSGTMTILKTLRLAVDHFENDFDLPKGRPRAKDHFYLIQDLVHFFREKIQDIVPSSASESPFCNLVNYLLTNVLEAGISNAKRHIDYALEEEKKHPH